MTKRKFRLTLTVEYTGDSEYYGTDVASEMAAIDEGVFQDDPATISYLVDGFDENSEAVSISVEPVE
jgi:hypothetical protein